MKYDKYVCLQTPNVFKCVDRVNSRVNKAIQDILGFVNSGF